MPADLHQAAERGDLKAVRTLLEAGSDPDGKDGEGWTPFLRAAKGGRVEILDLLLAAGAGLQARTPRGATALHIATHAGRIEAAGWLIEHGVELNPTRAANRLSARVSGEAGFAGSEVGSCGGPGSEPVTAPHCRCRGPGPGRCSPTAPTGESAPGRHPCQPAPPAEWRRGAKGPATSTTGTQSSFARFPLPRFRPPSP